MSEKEGGLPLIDAHAYLNQVGDLAVSLRDAKASGVRGIVAVGTDMESNQRTLAIATEHAGYVHAALGYHPWEIHGEEAKRNPSIFDNIGGVSDNENQAKGIDHGATP